jgi:hypothetical protein
VEENTNKELHDMYCSPSIVRVIKSRRMRWAGHVACMGEERGMYRVLVGRPKRRWKDNIMMDLQEVEVQIHSSWLKIGTGGGHL